MRIHNIIAVILLIASAPLRSNGSTGTAEDAFEKMKTLVGSWQATLPAGIQGAEFQLIANGSVIMESTQWRDAP
jgi:hypothetical protein